MNCIACKSKLSGKQTKYCSIKCKNKTLNSTLQHYSAQKEKGFTRKKLLVKELGNKCSKCSYSKNYTALEFHHLNSNIKKFTLDMRSLSNRSLKSINSEVKKCILVCSNCHQEIHYPEYNVNSTPQ